MKPQVWRDYDVDADKIEQLRAKVYEYALAHVNEIDLEDVQNRIRPPDNVLNNNNLDQNNNKTTDWMLKRFLISSHKEVDAALNKFIEFFTYRKQFHLSKMTLQNVFPREFFQLNCFDCEGVDKQQNRSLVIRLKYYKKLPQFEMLIKRGIMYFAEQLDLEYERGLCDGVCIILDCTDFGVTSVDMDLLQFITKQVPFSYAGIVRSMLIYEVPFLLSYLFKVVESWLPSSTDKNGNKRQLFHSVTKKNVKDFIDDDQRPDFLADGKRALKKATPADVLPFVDMISQVEGLEEQNARKIQEYLNQLCKTQ